MFFFYTKYYINFVCLLVKVGMTHDFVLGNNVVLKMFYLDRVKKPEHGTPYFVNISLSVQKL